MGLLKRTPRVLLVDGDRETRGTLRVALECAGFSVHEADSVAAALALASASQARLAVLVAQWMDPIESGHVFAAAADDPARLGQHRYLLLATTPRRSASPLVEPMERLLVEVVRSPFDVCHLVNVLEAKPAKRRRSRRAPDGCMSK